MVTRCNECQSTNVVKAGFDYRARQKVQRYRCKDCKKLFVIEEPITAEQLEALAKYARKGIKISELCQDLAIQAKRRQDMTQKQADLLIKCIEATTANG
jgi:transposase-like protein